MTPLLHPTSFDATTPPPYPTCIPSKLQSHSALTCMHAREGHKWGPSLYQVTHVAANPPLSTRHPSYMPVQLTWDPKPCVGVLGRHLRTHAPAILFGHPFTHMPTTPFVCPYIACSCRQTFPQPSAVRLQARALMLWLCGVWGVGAVLMNVCIYGSIYITSHSHPHHFSYTTLHRLSLSANLPTAISCPSASSGADAMARWCVVCWGSNGECMYL